MNVEIWADVICPWCGLGNHYLDAALARFDHRNEVHIEHRSFQLDPTAPVASTETVREYLRARRGMSDEQVDTATGRVERLATDAGLQPYLVADNRTGNTSHAHQLLAYAAEHGKGPEAWRLLYRAYFGSGRDIFDVDSLVELAADMGLNPVGARAVLESGRLADHVDADGRAARQLGASGVPFILIDGRYAVAGAQPPEVLLEILERAWGERADRSQQEAHA